MVKSNKCNHSGAQEVIKPVTPDRKRFNGNGNMIPEIFIFSVAVAFVEAQADCSRMIDGPCCSTCHSYTNCVAGVGTLVECSLPDSAFNQFTQKCDDISLTPPPCGKEQNCANLADGVYPDMTQGQECQSFFTCKKGVSLGKTACNAAGMVFSVQKQGCDRSDKVPEPCGTLKRR